LVYWTLIVNITYRTLETTMPKSKEQKRKEAVERHRKNYEKHAKHYASVAVGTQGYNLSIQRFGIDWANKQAEQAELVFKRFLADAHLDRNGNPLD
jgi:hypothetical protein